jgi:hypothetical protein
MVIYIYIYIYTNQNHNKEQHTTYTAKSTNTVQPLNLFFMRSLEMNNMWSYTLTDIKKST